MCNERVVCSCHGLSHNPIAVTRIVVVRVVVWIIIRRVLIVRITGTVRIIWIAGTRIVGVIVGIARIIGIVPVIHITVTVRIIWITGISRLLLIGPCPLVLRRGREPVRVWDRLLIPSCACGVSC